MAAITPTPALLALPPAHRAAVAAFAAPQHTMERLLRDAWAGGADLHDILILDEYTHDVILPLPPGFLAPDQPPLFLVYDST